jgi:hypothetical protein
VRYQHTEICDQLTHDDLLRHYVDTTPKTLESIDQLGNFLMGFGVLALGYLLQAELGAATEAVGGVGMQRLLGGVALGTWGVAVGLLVLFVHTYINRVIVGRSLHADGEDEERIGEVLSVPADMTWRQFISRQPTFGRFLASSYRAEDRRSPEALLYARWSYARFMAMRKLANMDRMRRLLGGALIMGVAFKVSLVLLGL